MKKIQQSSTGISLIKPCCVRLLSATLLLSLSMTSGVYAQQGGVLEEVTVTAQKREQSVQDVGIAITAFTGEQMNALGVGQSFDIATFSPGVHISGNLAGQNTQFSIRGVTQNDFNDIIEAPNAVYLDEGYLAVAQAQTFAVFDIDRVEILKGPQGTLFGRNATGGLVHYISNKPTLDGLDAYMDVTYGRYDSDADANHYRIEGAAGGPLSKTIAARVAFLYNKHDGYLKNNYDPNGPGAVGGAAVGFSADNSPGPGAGADMGDDDTYAIRGSLLFEPTDRLSVNLSVNYSESELATGPYQSKPTIAIYDGSGNSGELINVIDASPTETRESIAADGSDNGSDQGNVGTLTNLGSRPVPGGDFFGYIDPDGDGFNTSGDFAFEDQGSIQTLGVNNRIEFEISDSMMLTLVSDYKDYEKLLFIDVDSAPVNQLVNYAGVDATSFTQEVRLNGEMDRFRYVLGFYYLNIDSESDNGLKAPANSLPAIFGFGGLPVDIGVEARLETNSYSLFGQMEYDVTDQLTVIGGVRGIQEEKDYSMQQPFYVSLGPSTIHQGTPMFVINTFDQSTSDTLWAGKLQVDYHLNDDLLIYAGVNRGVKAGSFNAPIPGGLPVPNTFLPYDEEILISYEGGFKSSLFDGSTRVNGSVFYYDYQDYQAFLFTGVSGMVVNADATNVGVEFEIQTTPFAGLDAMLSFSWFDATVKDVPLRVNSPLPSRDVDPTYAPEIQVTGLLRYEWPMFNGMMHAVGNFSYSDEYFYNLRNFDADKFDSYVMVNMGLGWLSGNGHWQAKLKVNNVTDERAGIQGFDLASLCGCNEVSYQPPRWYGVNLRYNY